MATPKSQLRYDNTEGGSGAGAGGLRRMRLWPATFWLIAINAIVFVAQLASGDRVTRFGEFSVATAIHGFQLWRFFTFQFLHGDIWHLVFNMLALWYIGTIVETRLGAKRYLAFYLLCGICGALGYLALWRLRFLQHDTYQAMVGASAGIFGLLVAVLNLSPGLVVRYIFPPVSLRIRTLALIFLAVAVLTILCRGENAGGEAAHVGGALGGWLLITNLSWLNLFDRSKRRRRFWRPGDPATNFFRDVQ